MSFAAPANRGGFLLPPSSATMAAAPVVGPDGFVLAVLDRGAQVIVQGCFGLFGESVEDVAELEDQVARPDVAEEGRGGRGVEALGRGELVDGGTRDLIFEFSDVLDRFAEEPETSLNDHLRAAVEDRQDRAVWSHHWRGGHRG